MRLNDINKGVHKNRKRLRIGRGPGSGHGKTSGRGHKGQGQLAGWSAPSIFEGGRSPIIRRVPKRGFNNRHGKIVKSINVSDLESAFEAGADVTPELLRTSGVAKGIWHELKILGDGEISKSLSVSAHRFSKQAREKILAAGGSVSEVPGPAALVKGQKKVRDTEQSASP
ncbi:MAG: 50S ribosomal protein L15 [Planctomycetaceae bacterium]|jgi:large subunit ribosomal protein L15|nr:50S ribosomal protein L15 [Planctomycetaceae bacterium]